MRTLREVASADENFGEFFGREYARLARALVAEERLDVLRAVAMLPRGQREVLVLIEWLDLDIDEVGSLLGIAQATVRVRLHRARRALRE